MVAGVIKEAAQSWLDRGDCGNNFYILSESELVHKSYMVMAGTFTMLNRSNGKIYTVDHEQITPLHGSGVDDINHIAWIGEKNE